MAWKRTLEPFYRPLIYAWFKLARGLTLGVRGIVTNERGEVLLVEHTYVHGWHLPGGGVERGETCETAVRRELAEEGGVRLTGPITLLSIHSNHAHHPGDHVLVYRCGAWEPCESDAEGEVSRIGWFAPDALPEGIGPGHRRRIEEAFFGRPVDGLW